MRNLVSRFDSHVVPADSGDGFDVQYEYNSEGELVEVGKINVYDTIQAHADECDLGYLLQRALAGDQSALDQRIGQYVNTVGLPEDLLELKQIQNATADLVNSLTPEQKEAFLANPEKFFADQEKPVDKKAQLIAQLKELTGKEVTINE